MPLPAIAILPARVDEFPRLWPVIQYVIQHDNSHCLDPAHTPEKMQQIWFAPHQQVFKAITGDAVAGTFMMRANFDGHGKHIANGSFMVHPDFRGQRVGRAMGQFMIDECRRQGFRAIQFNSVVSTNEKALALWKSLGFKVIGIVPEAYFHTALQRYVDTNIMYQRLVE